MSFLGMGGIGVSPGKERCEQRVDERVPSGLVRDAPRTLSFEDCKTLVAISPPLEMTRGVRVDCSFRLSTALRDNAHNFGFEYGANGFAPIKVSRRNLN